MYFSFSLEKQETKKLSCADKNKYTAYIASTLATFAIPLSYLRHMFPQYLSVALGSAPPRGLLHAREAGGPLGGPGYIVTPRQGVSAMVGPEEQGALGTVR